MSVRWGPGHGAQRAGPGGCPQAGARGWDSSPIRIHSKCFISPTIHWVSVLFACLILFHTGDTAKLTKQPNLRQRPLSSGVQEPRGAREGGIRPSSVNPYKRGSMFQHRAFTRLRASSGASQKVQALLVDDGSAGNDYSFVPSNKPFFECPTMEWKGWVPGVARPPTWACWRSVGPGRGANYQLPQPKARSCRD